MCLFKFNWNVYGFFLACNKNWLIVRWLSCNQKFCSKQSRYVCVRHRCRKSCCQSQWQHSRINSFTIQKTSYSCLVIICKLCFAYLANGFCKCSNGQHQLKNPNQKKLEIMTVMGSLLFWPMSWVCNSHSIVVSFRIYNMFSITIWQCFGPHSCLSKSYICMSFICSLYFTEISLVNIINCCTRLRVVIRGINALHVPCMLLSQKISGSNWNSGKSSPPHLTLCNIHLALLHSTLK